MGLKQSIKEFFKPSPRNIGKSLLQGNPFVVIDVGAANGLIPHWHTLDGLATVVSFEPHEASYRDLLRKYQKSPYRDMYKPFPFGLSEKGGDTVLYMLNERTGSSILPVDPSSPWLNPDDPYVFPITETIIQTKSLKQVFEEENLAQPSMIKLDIQGAEIQVLNGLGDERLPNLVSIELEVGFHSIHKDAPTPFDTIEKLEKLGFAFYDMTTNRVPAGRGKDRLYYLRKLDISPIYNKTATRLVETDLLFFRDPVKLLDSEKAGDIRRQLVALCVYNFFTDALWLNDEALDRQIFSKDEHAQIEKNLREWSKIYNWKYPAYLSGLHERWKLLKSHLSHLPWQTPTRDL